MAKNSNDDTHLEHKARVEKWLGKTTISGLKREIEDSGERYIGPGGAMFTIDQMFKELLGELLKKFDNDWHKFTVVSIKVFHGKQGKATLILNNRKYQSDVPWLLCLEGEFRQGKRTIKTYGKFVSHPFYQYSKTASERQVPASV